MGLQRGIPWEQGLFHSSHWAQTVKGTQDGLGWWSSLHSAVNSSKLQRPRAKPHSPRQCKGWARALSNYSGGSLFPWTQNEKKLTMCLVLKYQLLLLIKMPVTNNHIQMAKGQVKCATSLVLRDAILLLHNYNYCYWIKTTAFLLIRLASMRKVEYVGKQPPVLLNRAWKFPGKSLRMWTGHKWAARGTQAPSNLGVPFLLLTPSSPFSSPSESHSMLLATLSTAELSRGSSPTETVLLSSRHIKVFPTSPLSSCCSPTQKAPHPPARCHSSPALLSKPPGYPGLIPPAAPGAQSCPLLHPLCHLFPAPPS